jgi:branched-subunit amino acid transport protein
MPFLVISNKKMPRKLKQFLEYVPYSALGALILPGAFNAIPQKPVIGLIGLLFAGLYAYKRGGMIIPVIGSITIVYGLLVLL